MFELLELLHGLRITRRTLKAGAKVVAGVRPETLNEMIRNAAAYAWEVGAGQFLAEVVQSSDDNPFLDPNWRSRVIPAKEGVNF